MERAMVRIELFGCIQSKAHIGQQLHCKQKQANQRNFSPATAMEFPTGKQGRHQLHFFVPAANLLGSLNAVGIGHQDIQDGHIKTLSALNGTEHSRWCN